MIIREVTGGQIIELDVWQKPVESNDSYYYQSELTIYDKTTNIVLSQVSLSFALYKTTDLKNYANTILFEALKQVALNKTILKNS